jgi:hypothetical protein
LGGNSFDGGACSGYFKIEIKDFELELRIIKNEFGLSL